MMEFWIFIVVLVVILVPYICISIRKHRQKLRQRATEMEAAFDMELNTATDNIEKIVAPVREKLQHETDQLKRWVYEAFIESYPRLPLQNLIAKRKSFLESHSDFKCDYVQKLYKETCRLLVQYSISISKLPDLYEYFDENTLALYKKFSDEYLQLGKSGYPSDKYVFTPKPFFSLKVGNIPIPTFIDSSKNATTIFIYPTFAIIYNEGGDFNIIDFWTENGTAAIGFSYYDSETTIYDNSDIPSDAKIVGYKWLYMTKKGEPDARYSHNPRYTRIKIYRLCLDVGVPHIGIRFIDTCSFHKLCCFQKALEDLVNTEEHKISCTKLEYDTEKFLNMSHDELVNWARQKIAGVLNTPNSAKQHQMAEGNEQEIQHVRKSKYKVGDKHPTQPWVWTEYAPGKFDWRKDSSVVSTEDTYQPSESDAMKELDSLIGLSSVKDEICKLQNFIKIQKIRESQGLKTSPISYHCVFTGNPGTGKTTVARIVAEIYRDMGILSKGHLVETDRSGLIAEYLGQTAAKTNKVVDSALDGVLFIDEAYSLVQGPKNDYGHEAISTLLKRIEDDRDRLVVILAGYGDEMKTFIDANPGLQSRFNRYIHFEDYSTDELLAIFDFNLKKHQYSISDSAKALLKSHIENAVANKDKNFGNGRFVRNLFEETLQLQATRLTQQLSDLTKEKLQRIEKEDIPIEQKENIEDMETKENYKLDQETQEREQEYVIYNSLYDKVLSCNPKTKGKVTLCEGVHEIAEEAFNNCRDVTEIVFPNSLTHIRERAFQDCSGLTSITLPKGCQSLSASAFAYCFKIKSFKFMGSCSDIPDCCFAGCLALFDFTFPEGLRTIGESAFFNCRSLIRLSLPEGITTIKKGTFDGCHHLLEINLPTSLETIEDSAFAGCSSIKQICLPKNVKHIGEGVFYCMFVLETITCLSKNPPVVDGKYDVLLENEDVTLFVLKDSYDSYAQHPYWGNYKIKTLE